MRPEHRGQSCSTLLWCYCVCGAGKDGHCDVTWYLEVVNLKPRNRKRYGEAPRSDVMRNVTQWSLTVSTHCAVFHCWVTYTSLFLLLINPLKSSGHYMYRQFNIQQFYVLPTQLYLCVLCGSENRERIFPYTALTDWSVYTAQWSLYVPHSGTICTAQRSLYVPHSGHYMYHHFNTQQFYVLPTQLYLCVLCGSENKQPLFPYTALTGWFVYTAQWSLYVPHSGTICTTQWSLYVPLV